VDMPGDRPHEAQRKGACLGAVAPAQPLPWRWQGMSVCRHTGHFQQAVPLAYNHKWCRDSGHV